KEIVVANSVCSVANRKGKGKVTGNEFCGKGKSINVSDVSKPDDGFSGKVRNVDVFYVSKPNVKRPFRKNTSGKTGCLAWMMVRKINGGMFEVYGFVEEHNHPLVSHEDMQFMISSRELGFSKQQFMLQVANSNVGPVRAFKLMKEMYGGFENVGAIATNSGSESRPPMLNKENYVSWSSRLLRYAKSRPNGKLIHNSILNGPYVRKMIPEPGDANRDITVTETFHLQIDDELSDKKLKQIKADDQAIQTILLGLPEDI
nr:hypothetical protein [Tanacetum cinerariifolium]